MALKLTFAGHAQLWAEIVLPRGDRVFVATAEPLELGAVVALTLESPELASPLVVTATVSGLRPATPSTPAGVVVNLNTNAVDRVQAALHEVAPTDLPQVRVASRPERQFAARVVIPKLIEGCSVKTLSTSSMTLTTPVQLPLEETVVIALQLPDGEVQVSAVVSWVRPELNLIGLRVGTLDPMALTRIKRALDADQKLSAEASLPSGHTIVIADDDPAILEILARVLTTAGHRVIRADRGDTALQMIKHERPKLIFLDVLMPGLDGLQVCTAVRADPSLTRTPVVLLSAMGEQRLLETVRECKASDSLTKPMKIDAVRAILSKYL